jgi:hypothetical protein
MYFMARIKCSSAALLSVINLHKMLLVCHSSFSRHESGWMGPPRTFLNWKCN